MIACPECGSDKILYDYVCHTYEQDGHWLSCIPCDSAIEYSCYNCKWRYTFGLNSRNPRAAANEACKPPWDFEKSWIDLGLADSLFPLEGARGWNEIPKEWYEEKKRREES